MHVPWHAHTHVVGGHVQLIANRNHAGLHGRVAQTHHVALNPCTMYACCQGLICVTREQPYGHLNVGAGLMMQLAIVRHCADKMKHTVVGRRAQPHGCLGMPCHASLQCLRSLTKTNNIIVGTTLHSTATVCVLVQSSEL